MLSVEVARRKAGKRPARTYAPDLSLHPISYLYIGTDSFIFAALLGEQCAIA